MITRKIFRPFVRPLVGFVGGAKFSTVNYQTPPTKLPEFVQHIHQLEDANSFKMAV
jgi:hypothetical protein